MTVILTRTINLKNQIYIFHKYVPHRAPDYPFVVVSKDVRMHQLHPIKLIKESAENLSSVRQNPVVPASVEDSVCVRPWAQVGEHSRSFPRKGRQSLTSDKQHKTKQSNVENLIIYNSLAELLTKFLWWEFSK